MRSIEPRKIIAVCGKSGSGKDSIVKEVLKRNPELHNIVSYTTRNKRETEEEGVDYFFISQQQMLEMLMNGDFFEVSLHNWFYGTGINSLVNDRVNIGVYNLEGIEALSQDVNIELYIFYITAKDKTRLLRILNREENPDVKEIIRRYGTDEIDFDNIDIILENCHMILENETKEDFDGIVNMITNISLNL